MEGIAAAIGNVLEGIVSLLIIDKLSGIHGSRRVHAAKAICIFANVMMYLYIKESGSWKYTLGSVLDILNFCLYGIVLKRQKFRIMFSAVMAASILNVFFGLAAAVFIYNTLNVGEVSSWYPVALMLGYLLRLLLFGLLCLGERKFQISYLLKPKRAQILIIILGILLQIARQPVYIMTEKGGNICLYIATTVLIVGSALGFLWLVDWFFAARERKSLLEDNQNMAAQLHKSKEIFPALHKSLEEMRANQDSEKLDKFLNEIYQLCDEQLDESEKEDIQFKSFPDTGLGVLDEQIRLYGKEAAEKGINLDVFVNAPMAEALKEHKILELHFLTLVGDLMRNAFRAVEKNEKKAGNILLAMGYVDERLEIEIHDDGTPFPMHILDEFGKRGNTEGGTGYGLADIVGFLERYQGTFQLTEYKSDSGFTKGIRIAMDGQNGRWINSFRSSQIAKDSILKSSEAK